MNNDPNVLLKVLLDSSDIGSSDIAKIQKILDKYTVHINAELDKTQLMNSVKNVLPQVIKEINKISGTTIKIDIDSSLIEKSIDQIILDSRRLKKELHDVGNEATTIAKNSANSVLKEQEKCEQGMNTSLKRLEASFQGFTDRILNTKVIKGILDFGNTITSIFHNITDQLGSTGATGVAGAGLFNHFLKDRSK
ncbi:MAG: hypothetical protein HFJ10_09160 [Lachnospiraceae bacterium]|nr:hypothetical protein [Lachnospiraceae bacterium]